MAQQYSLSVVPDASVPSGGHAFISVHGVTTPPDDDQIMIRRHGHRDRHLGPAGWQGPEIKLKPRETRLGKDVWALRFGPEVVDVIEEGTPVEIEVLGLGFKHTLHWPALLISIDSRGRRSRIVAGRRREPAKAVAVDDGTMISVPPEPEPSPTESRSPVPPLVPKPLELRPREPVTAESDDRVGEAEKTDRSKPWAMIIGLVALVAVVVAGIAFYYFESIKDEPVVVVDPVTEPDPPPTTVEPPVPSGSPVDMARAFLQGNPTAERAFERAEEAVAQGNLELALFLFEYAEGQGHGPAIAAIGKFYDPVFYQDGGATFAESNPRRALAYYNRAQAAGHDQSVDLIAGLRAWLQERAGQGDGEAERILNEVE
jgi:hypothetical protein